MLTPKDTFIIYHKNSGKDFFYVILSIIEDNTKYFALRITPIKQYSDTSCILTKKDHIYLTGDNVIIYDRPLISEIVTIMKLIDSGSDKIQPHQSILEDVFNRICKSALNSEDLPSKYLKYIPKSE